MSSPYKNSDHYNGSTFFNPGEDDELKGFFDLLKWKLTGNSQDWPSQIDPPYVKATPKAESLEKMTITFVNHATFLIQVDGINILTDPVWGKRVSPISFAGPKRVHDPGIDFDNLPRIDVVVISHNHYDHMDAETIKRLEDKYSPQFIVPLANAEKMKSFGAKRITELDWWDSFSPNSDFKITLTPAKHWSSRTLLDRKKALWGSFLIESKKEKVYFAGDTGYGTHFAEIFKRLGSPTVSLLPIGAYEPRWFMKGMHMNPEEAVLAHMDLQSKKSIGMHFGTFQLTDEGIDAPVKDLSMALDKLKVKDFSVLIPGQTIEL
ncbi:MAG: MBL fold metallo-hydrolase [Bdellovibrionales bacterium]|nr:MBL fold metallo-hydrolase [Bdellovibrionales bacterium]